MNILSFCLGFVVTLHWTQVVGCIPPGNYSMSSFRPWIQGVPPILWDPFGAELCILFFHSWVMCSSCSFFLSPNKVSWFLRYFICEPLGNVPPNGHVFEDLKSFVSSCVYLRYIYLSLYWMELFYHPPWLESTLSTTCVSLSTTRRSCCGGVSCKASLRKRRGRNGSEKKLWRSELRKSRNWSTYP